MALLKFSSRDRIGCKNKNGKVNWEEFKSHKFLSNLEWKDVLSEKIVPLEMLSVKENVSKVEKMLNSPKSKFNPKSVMSKPLSLVENKAATLFADYEYKIGADN